MQTAAIVKKREPVFLTIIGIVLLLGALAAVALLLVIPSLANLALGFQEYRPIHGLFDSPWVGLKNWRMAFANPMFMIGLSATFSHAFLSALLLFLSSLITGYLLLAVAKVRWLRHGLCTLLLIPLIIPGELLAQAFIGMGLYRAPASAGTALLIAAFCTVRYVGLPALLVSAAIGRGKSTGAVPLLAGGAAALIVFSLLGRFDFSFLQQMPPMLRELMNLDTFLYRTSLIMAQYAVGSVAGSVLALLRGILLVLIVFPVGLMIARLFPKNDTSGQEQTRDRLIALVLPGVVAAVAAVALIAAALPAISGGELSLYTSLPWHIIMAFVAAFINTILCYCLARPAACSGKAGKIVMLCVLVLLTMLSAGEGPISVGKFILIRSIGAMNTWFAILLSGLGAVWGVWPLIMAAKAMGVRDNLDWFRRMWKPSLALFAAQAALLMNDGITASIYANRRDMMHPLFLATQAQVMAASNGQMNLALLILATMAVPVILLLIARTALREEESLGLFLPGR